ncbi:GMC oxidoreductase [Rhizophagus clarus]|uniref:GMC oxidoreductase n=1 Tax=Rhizophagus clarus TaxID=94130 RepID=A0A8H3QLL5_9GLOM|nr:GMC oxidoreductase [Rhizophagus clarus]
MTSKLPYDIFPIIIEYLRHDRNTLFSCILVNRIMSTLGIPLLWKNPFSSDGSYNTINNYQSALLMRTCLSCLTEEERKYLTDKDIKIGNFQKPIFDYINFMKEILFCYPLSNSIICWILMEYYNYTKEKLNNIKNLNQINEYKIQNSLINSLYHIIFKKNMIKSFGISIYTIKFIDSTDYQFFMDSKISLSNLNHLVIYLKDECNDNNNDINQQSFNFLLDMIKKWCYNITYIKITNLLVFNDHKISKIQEIVNQQKKLQKLDLTSSSNNIVINDTLKSLRGHNNNFLTEMEISDTDLSDNLILEGLISVNSLKSLLLIRCKGISIDNIYILYNSLIILKKLIFFSNEFSLGLIISTIGKSLKELKTNQLDEESSEFILHYCTESLTHLELESIGIILNDLGFYLPKSLKYLGLIGLFTHKNLNVEHLENLLSNCNIDLESLEIYGSINFNILVIILNYIMKNKNFKSLIIDNLNCKEWKDPELSLLKDIRRYDIEEASDIGNYENFHLTENQIKVLRAFCGALIGELDESELATLLNTNSSIVKKYPEKVEEFGKFDLSKQENIIGRIIDRLLKSAPPYKLKQISSVLKNLSSKKGIINSKILSINKPFHELTQKQREYTFIKWSTSQYASVRKIYKSFTMLICATFWLNPYDFNPVIGYPGSDPESNGSRFTSRNFPKYDFLEISHDDLEIKEFDTIIIGSGAGGSVVAARLARMENVLVLEKGHHFDQSELSTEQQDGYDKLYELAGGMLSDDSNMYILAGSNFGGGTTIGWSAFMEPQYFVREEWAKNFGLPYFMEDEYGNAMKYINARLGTNTVNVTHNQSNQTLIDGCKKLGLHFDNIPQNTASIPHQCGWCSFGCKYGEKQSAIMTWLNEAKSNNAKFIQDCYVEKVLIEKDGKTQKVIGVEAIIKNIKKVKLHAKKVIVAGGAIHTPALLLRSGLKNKNIGRNLHVHPIASVYGVFPNKEVKTYSGTIMSAISNAIENVDGENYGAKIVVGSHHPGFMFANFPWKSNLQHKQLMLEYNHVVPLMVITRDRDGGRILTDDNGKPRLEYKLSQHDSKSMIAGLLTAIRILAAAGASKIGTCQAVIDDYVVENGVNPLNDPKFDQFLNKVKKVGIPTYQTCTGSVEQMSSCRMGDDPAKSAVNPVGETWEVENLYVADSSVFPTATGVPSMMTTMNIAHYISKCILDRKNYSVKKKRGSILRHLSFKDASFETKLTDNLENTDSDTLDKDFANNNPKEEPTSDSTTPKKEKTTKRLSFNAFNLKSFHNNN